METYNKLTSKTLNNPLTDPTLRAATCSPVTLEDIHAGGGSLLFFK